ncbi:MAG: N-acetylglucosamine kinase [Bacteroidota bacterium]|jgi:N-acetylglucosamine kinase-like BadF-type ATPase|nr:N-acetylglucosamine kinase [Bacteroidota bacterium]
MILIADSGSTKTDWRLMDENQKIHQFSSEGINPYFQDQEQIQKVIESAHFPSSVLESEIAVFFYGAGCKAEDKKVAVANALSSVIKKGRIIVESDMLGAARSVCGHNPGIAAILGTGMNSCYYDGENIVINRTSSGFILGDEGSGAHLGKLLVQAFLNDELPDELSKRFTERFKLSKDEVIDTVYRKPLPNRFLAGFSKFIYQNLKDQFMIDLVKGAFELFFDKHILKYPQHKEVKLSCSGSVAFYYSNILRSVAEDKGLNIDTIVETPIAGLTLYHLGE